MFVSFLVLWHNPLEDQPEEVLCLVGSELPVRRPLSALCLSLKNINQGRSPGSCFFILGPLPRRCHPPDSPLCYSSWWHKMLKRWKCSWASEHPKPQVWNPLHYKSFFNTCAFGESPDLNHSGMTGSSQDGRSYHYRLSCKRHGKRQLPVWTDAWNAREIGMASSDKSRRAACVWEIQRDLGVWTLWVTQLPKVSHLITDWEILREIRRCWNSGML